MEEAEDREHRKERKVYAPEEEEGRARRSGDEDSRAGVVSNREKQRETYSRHSKGVVVSAGFEEELEKEIEAMSKNEAGGQQVSERRRKHEAAKRFFLPFVCATPQGGDGRGKMHNLSGGQPLGKGETGKMPGESEVSLATR